MEIDEVRPQAADEYQSARRLPFPTDFTRQDRESLEQAAGELDEQRRRANTARWVQALEVADQYRALLLAGPLGRGGMTQVRELADREHRAFLDARQPPEGLGLDDATARKTAHRRIDALLRKLGTSSGAQRALAAEYDAKLMDVLSTVDDQEMPGYHIESHLHEWLKLSPLHDHPLPWGVKSPPDDVSDPHPPFLFRSPFCGFLFSFSWQAEGFVGDRELHLDPTKGFVGNTIRCDCDGADSHDFARAQADAQVAVGFVPPIAGILQVIVDAQCLPPAGYDLSIEDNFWISLAAAAQVNWLTISLLRADVTETQVAKMDSSE